MNKPKHLNKPSKMPQKHDLLFISGGIVKETVLVNVDKALANWKKLQIKHLYTNGILVVVPNGKKFI